MDEKRNPDDADAQFTRPPTIDDLIRICRYLNEERARYVIIGGMAVNHYGLVRGTQDIDLLVDMSPENMKHVICALSRLSDGAAGEIHPEEIQQYSVIRINDEITVDLIGKACDVTYERAEEGMEIDMSLGEPLPFASIATLISTKKTFRDADRRDREFLEELLRPLT
jgi:hypothetical protein